MRILIDEVTLMALWQPIFSPIILCGYRYDATYKLAYVKCASALGEYFEFSREFSLFRMSLMALWVKLATPTYATVAYSVR